MSDLAPTAPMAAPMAALETDAAALVRHWAAGPLLCGHWLIGLLDSQTAWWKAAEGCLASWAQPLFEPRMAAGRYAAAPFGYGPLQIAWEDWGRLWLNALRHDAAQT